VFEGVKEGDTDTLFVGVRDTDGLIVGLTVTVTEVVGVTDIDAPGV